MSVDEREIVKGMYPKSRKWGARVDHMPDGQVHAIYVRYMNLLDEQVKNIPDNHDSDKGEF